MLCHQYKNNFITLKNKLSCRLLKSILSEHEVKNIMVSLWEDLVVVPIDKAANNVAFIGKHFFALSIIKQQNFDCHLSNQDGNNNYTFVTIKTKDQIIKEKMLLLPNHEINSSNNMQDLPVMY